MLQPKRVKLGQKINHELIPKFQAKEGQKHIVCILSDEAIPVRTHWLKRQNDEGETEHFGAFYCFGGACCDVKESPVHYIVPVVEYTLKGTTLKQGWGLPISFKYWRIGFSNWDKLTSLFETFDNANLSILDYDLVVEVEKGKEKYQALTIQDTRVKAQWKSSKEARDSIATMLKMYDAKIEGIVAKSINEAQYFQYLQGGEIEAVNRKDTLKITGDNNSFTNNVMLPSADNGDFIDTEAEVIDNEDEEVSLDDLVANG